MITPCHEHLHLSLKSLKRSEEGRAGVNGQRVCTVQGIIAGDAWPGVVAP